MPNKKRKVANTSDLVKLAQELIDNPREKANNLPILIPYLDCTSHQVLYYPCILYAIIACTLHFNDQPELLNLPAVHSAAHPKHKNIFCRLFRSR